MDTNRVVFEEFPNGVVKASISGCTFDALNKINRKFVSTVTASIEIADTWTKAAKKYKMNSTYSAIARCMQGDEYSFEEGKKIALKKLNEKYNKSMDKRINLFLKHIKQVCNNTEEYMKNHIH